MYLPVSDETGRDETQQHDFEKKWKYFHSTNVVFYAEDVFFKPVNTCYYEL